ncbi:MAG: ABC transporter permease subunit [Oscillospiraceae bacterium]|nr:ABC transporter permease subunit [Oscillospiraceae bacterium]
MRILRLELKRMLKAKLTLILLVLSLLFSALLAYLPTTYCYSNYTDEAGNEISLTGLASIAYEKERQADAAGIVTPERVREAVEIYQACLASYGVKESYDLPEGVYEREILPIAPLLHGVREAFADPNTGMAPTIMEIDPEQVNDYYSVCEARIVSLMAMEQPDSQAAQRKAVEMYRQIEKPFEVYPGMSSAVMDYQNIMGFLVLLFCVVIAAPVFSADYQSGADDVLRCTKYGRINLGVAKLLAALLMSGLAFIVCAVTFIVVTNSLFGWECIKTSVQMMYSIVTLAEMNIGQLQVLFAVAGLLTVLASVGFTLFLSSKCKKTVSSLAASLVFCIAPVVICMTVPGALSTWLCSILPASGTSIQASMLYAITDFQFLNFGRLAVWTPYAMIGACVIEIPLFSFLAIRSYCKHTVN